MSKHIYYIPDCPKCGKELEQRIRYIEGTQTKRNPFGKQKRWYQCECGYRKEVE